MEHYKKTTLYPLLLLLVYLQLLHTTIDIATTRCPSTISEQDSLSHQVEHPNYISNMCKSGGSLPSTTEAVNSNLDFAAEGDGIGKHFAKTADEHER